MVVQPPLLSAGPPDLSREQVEARFAWARAAGHPDYLWPGLPVESWRGAVRSITHAVGTVLRGVPGPPHLSASDTASGRALGIAGYTTGVGPLLGYWIETGQVVADPEADALLRSHFDHARRRAVRVDAEVGRATSALSAAGVRAAVIKGTHTAHAYFPEPGTRPGSDIDLVVAPERLEAACSALAAAGYEPGRTHGQADQRTWWPPGVRRLPRSLEMVHADDPYSIDLHDSFGRPFGGTRTVTVVDGARMLRPWPRHGGAAHILGQPGLVAHLALHASEAFRSLTLIRLVELVFVLRQDLACGALALDALHDLLEERRALPYVYPAFVLAERLVPGTVEPGFLALLRKAAPRRLVTMLDRLRPETVQRLDWMSVQEWFMWTHGPTEHARRALRWLWAPSVRGSWRALGRLYVRRLHRLRHGRIRLRRR